MIPNKKHVWIHPAIRHSGLPAASILLYAEISHRCGTKDFTWVTTKRLAEDLHIGRTAATAHLRKLEEAGLIKRMIDPAAKRHGARRKILIWLQAEEHWTLPRDRKANTPCSDSEHGRDRNPNTAVYEKSGKVKRDKREGAKPPRKRDPHLAFEALEIPDDWRIEPLREAWEGYLEMRTKKRAKPTERAVELLARELQKHAPDVQTAIAILDKSTANNWTGVFALKPDEKPANLSTGGSNPLIQS